MIKFFLEGVEFVDLPVTQNGYGRFYQNPKTGAYWRTHITKFDNATPPKGYYAYNNGSHKYSQIISPAYIYPNIPPSSLLQLAYDLEGNGGDRITADLQLEVMAVAPEFVKVRRKNYNFWIGHLDMRTVPKVGTYIEPGQTIGRLLNSNSHVHIYSLKDGKQFPIKDIILYNYSDMKPGDKLIYTKNTNLRTKPSASSRQVAIIQPNAVGIVADGPVSAGGYTWYFLKFRDVSGWAIEGDKTNKDRTYVNGTPYVNYENKYNEAMVEIDKLRDRNTELATKVVELQKKTNELQVIVDENQAVVDALNEQIIVKDKRIERLESQLKTCQEGVDNTLKAAFAWFTKTLNTLWASFLEWLKGFKEED